MKSENYLRDWETAGFQGHMLSGWRPESICNSVGCATWGRRDGDVNWIQGHIQLALRWE